MSGLKSLLTELSGEKVRVSGEKYRLSLEVDLRITDFKKIKPGLSRLLNDYQEKFFILVRGLPYCFLAEAREHLLYKKDKNKKYLKPKECRGCLYFNDCPGLEAGAKSAKVSPVKDLPQEIAFELTKECNQNCLLCSLKGSPGYRLGLERIKETLREGRALGIKRVLFTGGEPFLHQDIVEVLRYAKRKGFYLRVNTNATLLDEDLIKRIAPFLDNVLISLQGYNAGTEKALTGSARLFERKLKNIARLKKSSIPIIRIGTIISKILTENFISYYKIIRKLGIKRWELYRPMLGDKGHPEYRLEKKDFNRLAGLILYARKRGGAAIFGNTLPFCISQRTLEHPEIFAGNIYDDGHIRLVMDAGGFFKPSYFIDKDLGGDIKAAWQNRFLKKIRGLAYLPGRCRECAYLSQCKGGSRFLARKQKGDFFAPDPWSNG